MFCKRQEMSDGRTTLTDCGQLVQDIDFIDMDKDNWNAGSAVHVISFPEAAILSVSTKSRF